MNKNFEPIKRTKQRVNVSETAYSRSQAKKNVKLERQQARKNKRLTLAAGDL